MDKRCSVPLDPLAESSDIRFANWEKIASPERLIRDFSFSSREALLQFVSEIITFEDKLGHHGRITVEVMTVRVEVYTHDIERVTELDHEYAKYDIVGCVH